jgi:hypothetical protein
VKAWLKRDNSLANEEHIVPAVALEQPFLVTVSFTSTSGCASLHISHVLKGVIQGISLDEEWSFK